MGARKHSRQGTTGEWRCRWCWGWVRQQQGRRPCLAAPLSARPAPPATQRARQSSALSRWQDAQRLVSGTLPHAGTPTAARSPPRFEQRPVCPQRHSRGERRRAARCQRGVPSHGRPRRSPRVALLLLLLLPSARFQPRCLGDPASLPLPPGRTQGRAQRPAHSRGSRPLPLGRPCRAAAMSRRCRCCRATRRRAGLARGATGAAGPGPGLGLSPASLAAPGGGSLRRR